MAAPSRVGSHLFGNRGGRKHDSRAPFVIGAASVCAVVLIVLLSLRATHRVNRVPLEAAPRPVTVIAAPSSTYRDSRTYVGAVRPWVEASVGPQYVSAYVLTVLVRPGDVVKEGQTLATLDCSTPNAASRALRMEARAVDARRRAAEDEATRIASMLDGGFVAPNDVEQKSAVSLSDQAQLLKTEANVLKSSLDVRDCVLRAPFDGEIGIRSFDPGAFVHPGDAIVSVVDRDTVRIVVDAPEKDFEALAPSTPVEADLLATGGHLEAPISRRSPRADPRTRTVHFEVDVRDPERRYPTETTAIVHVGVGQPVPATEVPIYAATQGEGKAKLFVVVDGVAHERNLPLLGEVGGGLFFGPQTLPAGTLVVTEGRALLSDGEKVQAHLETERPEPGPGDAGAPAPRGGGYGRSL